MTEPKILTPQEALRALAEGRKLTFKGWSVGQFFQLENGGICDESGKSLGLVRLENCILYTEPKPKRKVAPYIMNCFAGPYMTSQLYSSDEECVDEERADATIVRRVMELEVEIED